MMRLRPWLGVLALVTAGCSTPGPMAPAGQAKAGALGARSVGSLEGEIRALDQAAFAAHDRNADGRLSPVETGAPTAAAFAAWDLDADGFIGAAEYQAARGDVAERAEVARAVLAASASEPETAEIASWPLKQAFPTFAVEAAADGNPVVCVPGFLDLELYFAPYRKKIEKLGRRTAYLSVFPNVGDIRNAATELSRLVAQVKQETGAAKVDILAHSMGGLISRTYLKDYDGLRHVDRLVTLASPHHGTVMAKLAPTSGAAQMRPGSSFLTALNADDETPGAVKYTSVRGGLDELIIPHSSPILEGAVENALAPVAMHGTIFVDPVAWKAVKRGLAR